MPCEWEPVELTDQEIEASRIACLVDEINGVDYSDEDWAGYHKRAIADPQMLDNLTQQICAHLKKNAANQYSKRMQRWWEKHQDWDRRREEQEAVQEQPVEKPYMDWPTAQKLLKESSDRANAIREEYLQTCGKHLEGKYFKERGTAYKIEKAYLGKQGSWLDSTIYLKCCETNSRGEPSDRIQTLTLGPRRYSDEAIANKTYDCTIEGTLSLGSNGEEDDLLAIGEDKDILAKSIGYKIEEHGSASIIRYWIAHEPLTLDELQEIPSTTLSGNANCSYDVFFDEGYYEGTIEKIQIGGYDLLGELKGYIGKFLRMEITFDR